MKGLSFSSTRMQAAALWMACLVTAAVVFVAGRSAVSAWYQHQAAAQALARMEARQRTQRIRLAELRSKLQAMEKVRTFVQQVETLGLSPEAWQRFEVQLQGPVTFAELARVIDQAAGSRQVLFAPIAFAVQPPGQEALPSSSSAAAAPAASGPGDVTVTLQGAFLVRR